MRLDELTRAPLVLGAGAPRSRSFTFELPADARQGPDVWYTIRLSFRVTFARDSGSGFAWVMADTNRRTSAQIEFTTSRVRNRLRVRRTSVDLVNGQLEHVSWARTSGMTFRNYLQLAGVRGGTNELTLRLEEAGRARVQRLEVLGDTAIVRTTRSPYPLRLDARLLDERVRVGETFRVRVALGNRTGERLERVTLRPALDEALFAPVSAPPRRWARLTRPVAVEYTFRALATGEHELGFLADSSRNHPSATLRVTVLPERETARSAAVWGVALLPFLLVGGWVLRSRRRR